jgi:hypothetical protein
MSKKEAKRPLAMNKDITNLGPLSKPSTHETKQDTIRDVKSHIETAVATVKALSVQSSENEKPPSHTKGSKSKDGGIQAPHEVNKKVSDIKKAETKPNIKKGRPVTANLASKAKGQTKTSVEKKPSTIAIKQ